MTELFAALAAVKEIIDSVTAIMAFVKANQQEQWFQDATTAFAKIKGAQTDEERRQAASGLRDIFQRL